MTNRKPTFWLIFVKTAPGILFSIDAVSLLVN
nr:MAG TPA: hypothetical protein [Caudoviricetes sp.]DAT69846.1 MAG TPA: Dicer N-terminal domain protein [Caudoviricetes sp.]